MMTIEIQSWKLSIKTVYECHSLCNVNGKLDSSVRVHNKSEMNSNTVGLQKKQRFEIHCTRPGTSINRLLH